MLQMFPKALIFAGSSGSGKTTITKHLLAHNPQFRFSISACTRNRRPQEIHGQDYYFLSVQEFKQKIAQQAFIEWEEVYKDSYYGTLKSEVERIGAADEVALFDIDVRGGLRLKSFFKENALAVYIQAPSIQLLLERLKGRKTEGEEEITRRMRRVVQEAQLASQFDIILTNEQLAVSLQQAQQLVDTFLQRS